MTMTPADVENRRFRRRWRGFDRDEVLQFLGEVSEAMLELAGRVEELEQARVELKRRVSEARAREGSVQDALASVGRLSEQVRDEARREAALVLREARFEAEAMLRHAREQAARIEEDIVALRVERDSFEDRVRAAADDHVRLLDARREEAEVREKMRILSLRHAASAPPLPFSETLRPALPAPADDEPTRPDGTPMLRSDPGVNTDAN